MTRIISVIFVSLFALLGCKSGGGSASSNGGDALKYLTPPQRDYQTFDLAQQKVSGYEYRNPDTGMGIPADLSCKIIEPYQQNECDMVVPEILRVFDINGKYALIQARNATVEFKGTTTVGEYSFVQDKTSGELYPMVRDGELQTLWIADEFVSKNSSDNIAYDDALYQLQFTEYGSAYQLIRYQLDDQKRYFVSEVVYEALDNEQIYGFAADKDNNVIIYGPQLEEHHHQRRVVAVPAFGVMQEWVLPVETYPATRQGEIITILSSAEFQERYYKYVFHGAEVSLEPLDLAEGHDLDQASLFRGNITRGDYFMDMNGKVFDISERNFELIHDEGWWEDCYTHCLRNVATQEYLITLNISQVGGPTEALVFNTQSGEALVYTTEFVRRKWEDGYQFGGVVATQHNEFKLIEFYQPQGSEVLETTEHYFNVETLEEYTVVLTGKRASLKVFSYLNE